MMLKKPKAVLFDLDGTLIDSEWFYYKAWKAVLATYGFILDSECWLTSLAGKTDVQAIDVLQKQYNFQPDVNEFLTKVKSKVAQQYDEELVPLMPGAKELINYLHKEEIMIALVTSSKREVATYYLEAHDLMKYFRCLVTRTEVKNTKPHPEPYLMCVEQLGVDKQDCLVLEDSVTGTTAAKAAGLMCWGVQTHESIRQSLLVDRMFDNLHQVLEEFLADS
ncbi:MULTISPECIES: HAD family hydrolase [Olivibacter]|uniref:HAD family hydrolase n=1 Tax=Olivibacter jilunii TaxID=985016 RepID=A0ABW6B884_9SPHI|nr:HAD family phosphatase [Olivibacter sp. UJ_SKK_5.1]MDX3912803.1 HAD family phosphatase [Pseudosphingobacterium sp.]